MNETAAEWTGVFLGVCLGGALVCGAIAYLIHLYENREGRS